MKMYAEPENSYGDITRYFTENEIMVYGKTLKRGFVGQLLRNPVYVRPIWIFTNISRPRARKSKARRNCSQVNLAVTCTRAARGGKHSGDCAPQGRIPSSLWLAVQHKLSQKYHVPEWPQMPQYMAGRENQVWMLWVCAGQSERSKRCHLYAVQATHGKQKLSRARHSHKARLGKIGL